jgi:Tol biopolymer transport system component
MRTGLVAILALGLALVLSSCGDGGKPRPDLAFVSTRDGDYAIFEMNADGGRQNRLTETDVDTVSPRGLFFQIDPAWSPDGRSLAFASKRSGSFDIYVMRADGSGTRPLTATADDDLHPTWSPDGKWIAFERDRRIYAIQPSGGGLHVISRGFPGDTDPAWSPGGTWIAFVRRVAGGPVREIWMMRSDGREAHRVTALHGSSINPAWSPNGKRVVFASNIVGSLYDLYVASVRDGRVRRLTREGPDAFEPAWSPDGATIAFAQDGAITTTDLSGHIERLTDTKNNDSSPAWNPRPAPSGG